MNNPSYIITGASSGIGKAVTKHLLGKGKTVMGVARDMETSQFDHAENLRRENIDFSNHAHLVTRLEQLKKQIHKLEGIICCAGYGQFSSLEEFSYDQIKRLMDVNFLAHAYLCKTFIPLLKQQEKGDIVFIGSEAALKGSRKGSIYCASKFALRGFAQALRDECARNHVRVSIINPGMTNSAFYNELDFSAGDAKENAINVEDVASSIIHVLESNQNIVYDEINLSPLKHVIKNKDKKSSAKL